MKTSSKKMEKTVSILLIAFLIASFVWMAPHTYVPKPDGHTTKLHAVTTQGENVERKDYVDDDGVLRMAGDVGYATVITTISDKSRLEQYYDESGLPVKRQSGYYAVLREYDAMGRNYHVSYLDMNNEPIITLTGYSDVYRIFYDSGKLMTEKYYDSSGNPVCTSTYGYGYRKEYDENGKKVKITYLDENDRPMQVGLGCSIVIQTYYDSDGPDNGKVEYEFYYDENEKPAEQSLGHYGVLKADYNTYGQNTVLVYLNPDGQPMATKRGYASVVRTYYTDGSRKMERYFDVDGNPYMLPDGQYGEKYESDQVVYLDKNGNEQFSLRRLLYNHSYIVILTAIMIVVLSVSINRRTNLLLLLLYCTAIVYMTLLFRENINEQRNTAILYTFRCFFTDDKLRLEVLKNIWLFIPLGAILSQISQKKTIILIPVMISILIEIIQYCTKTGYCELDDIISNSLGGVIGYTAGHMLFSLKNTLFHKDFEKQPYNI